VEEKEREYREGQEENMYKSKGQNSEGVA